MHHKSLVHHHRTKLDFYAPDDKEVDLIFHFFDSKVFFVGFAYFDGRQGSFCLEKTCVCQIFQLNTLDTQQTHLNLECRKRV